MPTRRLFIGGLAASASPLAAKPMIPAQERADYHYGELVRALDEVAADFDGWDLRAMKRKPAAGRNEASHKQVSVVRYDVVESPRMVFECHQTIG